MVSEKARKSILRANVNCKKGEGGGGEGKLIGFWQREKGKREGWAVGEGSH